jgi:hypothetical protein
MFENHKIDIKLLHKMCILFSRERIRGIIVRHWNCCSSQCIDNRKVHIGWRMGLCCGNCIKFQFIVQRMHTPLYMSDTRLNWKFIISIRIMSVCNVHSTWNDIKNIFKSFITVFTSSTHSHKRETRHELYCLRYGMCTPEQLDASAYFLGKPQICTLHI